MARAGVGGFLVVSPFDCVWLEAEDLRFPHPGRGRISFEVRGENDATVILKDSSGHRHYRTDTTRNYTVVIGSHRNRSIRIEADGKSVADVDAPDSLEPQRYRRFWINVWDGVVSVGKVEADGDDTLLQFVDSCPNLAVRFAGLSSWDKHVAYRNVKMSEGQDLPLATDLDQPDTFAAPTPLSFLNSPTFADICFQVGPTQETFYAHRIVLACNSWPCVQKTGSISQKGRATPGGAHHIVPTCNSWPCLQQAGSISEECRANPGAAPIALSLSRTGQAVNSHGIGGSTEVGGAASSSRHTREGLNFHTESSTNSKSDSKVCNLIGDRGTCGIGETPIQNGLRIPYGNANDTAESRNGDGVPEPVAQAALESSERSSIRGPQAPEIASKGPRRLVHVDVPQGSPEDLYVFLRHLYEGAVDLASTATRSPHCPCLEPSQDAAERRASLDARPNPAQPGLRPGENRTGSSWTCHDGNSAECRLGDGAGNPPKPDTGSASGRVPGQRLRAATTGAPATGAPEAGAHSAGQDTRGQDRIGQSSRAQLDKGRLRRFCGSAELADVVLSAGHCGSCSFPAHSLVLSTSSPVLHRMLCSDMSEGRSRRIVLGETSCAAVAALLHFIYCGDLPTSLAGNLATRQAEPRSPGCHSGQPTPHGYWSDDSDMPGRWICQPGSNISSSQATQAAQGCGGAWALCADPSLSRESLLLDLLMLSDRLCMRPLCALAQDALASTLTPEVALKALATAAQLPGCKALHARAGHFCALHFEACVAKSPHDLLNLEIEEVCSILEDSNLSLGEEEVLLDCLVSWALSLPAIADWRSAQAALEGAAVEAHEQLSAGNERCSLDSDPGLFEAHTWSDDESTWEGREAHLERLMDFVSFSSLPVATLHELAQSPLIHLAPSILEKAQDALHCLAGPPRTRGALPEDGSRPAGMGLGSLEVDKGKRAVYSWRPRGVLRSFILKQPQEVLADLQYICDGDENGLLFFAGTSYGRHPWMNPVMLGTLEISASSPPSRHTDGRVLASRNYAATSFAGPTELDGTPSAWWMVDLGAQRMLMCNHYSLRQDGSTSFPRSWILEGSKDGSNWTVLREHFNDATLSQPGLYGSWTVDEPTACRYFRIRLMSPASGSNVQWQLHTCYVEFYGLLF